VTALEKAKAEKELQGEFESEHPGYCGAQDTFYVGTLKGVGRVYQQTFIDTYAKIGFAKLYDRKTPITAADLLNDRVLPFSRRTASSYSVFSPIAARSFSASKYSASGMVNLRDTPVRSFHSRPRPHRGLRPCR
jgi:hypothetical protein